MAKIRDLILAQNAEDVSQYYIRVVYAFIQKRPDYRKDKELFTNYINCKIKEYHRALKRIFSDCTQWDFDLFKKSIEFLFDYKS